MLLVNQNSHNAGNKYYHITPLKRPPGTLISGIKGMPLYPEIFNYKCPYYQFHSIDYQIFPKSAEIGQK